MIQNTIKTLEFNKIQNKLSEYAISESAKRKILELKPFLNEREIKDKIRETSEARIILDAMGLPPMPFMKDIMEYLDLSEKGGMLTPEQLTEISIFLTSCKRMKAYLKKAEAYNVNIATYGGSIQGIEELIEEINLSIRNNQVEDNASKNLKDIRRKIEKVRDEIKNKLEKLLRSKKDWFTEGYVSKRNGHYVLPVKKEFKNQMSGSVLDISSTGSTYFMEPSSVMKLEDELNTLEIEEENEVRKILYTLTDMVVKYKYEITINIEALEILDFIFAKGKLSSDMKATEPSINTEGFMEIVNGRHPLLNQEYCVPLNFSIGRGIRGVVITGPNTGGKTVALKTVGLLQLMASSGLHIPCENANICMTNIVLCDIGDGQSITENLSTFSSHITNVIEILKHSDKESFVLLDELGSGTDPAEGMGIAIAILEELLRKNCLFVATTHYPRIKEYAKNSAGLINARMAFDRDTLKPLYRLEIGEAGESCALYIAKRLGLPKHMLERAYMEAYEKEDKSIASNVDASFLENATENTFTSFTASIQKEIPKKQVSSRSLRFQIGDSVVVYPQKKIGIVFQCSNEKGEVGVQIQKNKQWINHKRLQLKAAACELYPEDYDFSIIFDSVEIRKARHQMGKKHQPDLEIYYEKE